MRRNEKQDAKKTTKKAAANGKPQGSKDGGVKTAAVAAEPPPIQVPPAVRNVAKGKTRGKSATESVPMESQGPKYKRRNTRGVADGRVDVSVQFSSQKVGWVSVLDRACELLRDVELAQEAMDFICPIIDGDQAAADKANGVDNWLGVIPVPPWRRNEYPDEYFTVAEPLKRSSDGKGHTKGDMTMDICQHVYLTVSGSKIVNDAITAGVKVKGFDEIVKTKKRRHLTIDQMTGLTEAVTWAIERERRFCSERGATFSLTCSDPTVEEVSVSTIISFGSPELTYMGCPCVHIGATPYDRFLGGDGMMNYKTKFADELAFCVELSRTSRHAAFWVLVMAFCAFSGTNANLTHRTSCSRVAADYALFFRSASTAIANDTEFNGVSPFPPPPVSSYPRGRRGDEPFVIVDRSKKSLYTWTPVPAFADVTSGVALANRMSSFIREQNVLPFIYQAGEVKMNRSIRHNAVTTWVFWSIGITHWWAQYEPVVTSARPDACVVVDYQRLMREMFLAGAYKGFNVVKKIKGAVDEATKLMPAYALVPEAFEWPEVMDRGQVQMTYYRGEYRTSDDVGRRALAVDWQPQRYGRCIDGYRDLAGELEDSITSDLDDLGLQSIRDVLRACKEDGKVVSVYDLGALFEPVCCFGYAYSDHCQATLQMPDHTYDYPDLSKLSPEEKRYADAAMEQLKEFFGRVANQVNQTKFQSFTSVVEDVLSRMTTDKRSGYKVSIQPSVEMADLLGRSVKRQRGGKVPKPKPYTSGSKAMTQAFMLKDFCHKDAMFRLSSWISPGTVGERSVTGARLKRAMYMIETGHQIGLSLLYEALLAEFKSPDYVDSVVPYRRLESASQQRTHPIMSTVRCVDKLDKQEEGHWCLATDYSSMDQHMGWVIPLFVDILMKASPDKMFNVPVLQPDGSYAMEEMTACSIAGRCLLSSMKGVFTVAGSQYLRDGLAVPIGNGHRLMACALLVAVYHNTSGNQITTGLNCINTLINLGKLASVFGDDSHAFLRAVEYGLEPGVPLPHITGGAAGIGQKVSVIDSNIGVSTKFLKFMALGLQMSQRVRSLTSEHKSDLSPTKLAEAWNSEYEAFVRSGSEGVFGTQRVRMLVRTAGTFSGFGYVGTLGAPNWLVAGGAYPRFCGVCPITAHDKVYEFLGIHVHRAFAAMGLPLSSEGTDVASFEYLEDSSEDASLRMMAVATGESPLGFTVTGRLPGYAAGKPDEPTVRRELTQPLVRARENLTLSADPGVLKYSVDQLAALGRTHSPAEVRMYAKHAFCNQVHVKAAKVLQELISENSDAKMFGMKAAEALQRAPKRVGIIPMTDMAHGDVRRYELGFPMGTTLVVTLVRCGTFSISMQHHASGGSPCSVQLPRPGDIPFTERAIGRERMLLNHWAHHPVGITSRGKLGEVLHAMFGYRVLVGDAAKDAATIRRTVVKGRPDIGPEVLRGLINTGLAASEIENLLGGKILPQYKSIDGLRRLMAFQDIESMGGFRMTGAMADVDTSHLEELGLLHISPTVRADKWEANTLREHVVAFHAAIWNSILTYAAGDGFGFNATLPLFSFTFQTVFKAEASNASRESV